MIHEAVWFYGFYAVTLLIPMALYLRHQNRKEQRAKEAAQKGELFSEGPRGQHPHIDVTQCIGCQGCTSVCPEGQVLGMVGGKAAVVKPYRCIGHGQCADACPVGAIQLVTASASVSADLPYLTPENETNIPNLFIAGELGGLALIRNAVRQGRECVDTIAQRIALRKLSHASDPQVLDVLIIGAGPAGISASLRAIEHKLRYLTIERDAIGGTVAKYPRQKMVMLNPVEFPLYGSFRKGELSKEHLLAFWKAVGERPDFHVRLNEPVEHIARDEHSGIFTVTTQHGAYRSHAVVLALGRNGVPRTLGVKGEHLPKVMYRLIEADHYINRNILIVGGGDSAVEAAVGLSMQKGNRVTLSYRREAFMRIKERNARRLEEAQRSGKVEVIFNSLPVEFTPDRVVLNVDGVVRELPNDYVWIFAGGVGPNDFLKKIGIAFGAQDLTAATVRAAAAEVAVPVQVEA